MPDHKPNAPAAQPPDRSCNAFQEIDGFIYSCEYQRGHKGECKFTLGMPPANAPAAEKAQPLGTCDDETKPHEYNKLCVAWKPLAAPPAPEGQRGRITAAMVHEARLGATLPFGSIHEQKMADLLNAQILVGAPEGDGVRTLLQLIGATFDQCADYNTSAVVIPFEVAEELRNKIKLFPVASQPAVRGDVTVNSDLSAVQVTTQQEICPTCHRPDDPRSSCSDTFHIEQREPAVSGETHKWKCLMTNVPPQNKDWVMREEAEFSLSQQAGELERLRAHYTQSLKTSNRDYEEMMAERDRLREEVGRNEWLNRRVQVKEKWEYAGREAICLTNSFDSDGQTWVTLQWIDDLSEEGIQTFKCSGLVKAALASGQIGDTCPKCHSTAPHLHPAVQFEGEVQPCDHDFHRQVTPQNTEKRIAEVDAMLSGQRGEKN